MVSSLKRFSSCFICLIFYIFLFTTDFYGNSFCNAASNATPATKFVPIDIHNNFNSNAIWGNGDDWDEKFKSEDSYNAGEESKIRKLGIEGNRAFYTKYNYDQETNSSNTDTNYGMPNDGRLMIGGIPFNFNASSGNDCIKLCKELNQINYDISLGGIKVKNLYIIGTAGAVMTENIAEADVKFYDKNSNEITKYAQKLDVYDFFDSEQMSQCKGKNESSILDYKHYGTKNLLGVYENDKKFYMQCWRLNKFQEGSTFGDEEISKINVGFEGKGIKKSDFKPVEVSGACLTVFAITAEVEYDNNIVSNAKYNSFQIACETAGNKQIKISETSGLNNEDMITVEFPCTYLELDEGQTYYCTVYDSDKNAYYYFEVKTKKSF